MELSGKIIAVLPKTGGISKTSGKQWSSQSYVIETSEQYPHKVCFEVFGEEKIGQFNIQNGEELTISFDIQSNEWNGKWFTKVQAWKVKAWKVERAGVTQHHEQPAPQPQATVDFGEPKNFPTAEASDLPF